MGGGGGTVGGGGGGEEGRGKGKGGRRRSKGGVWGGGTRGRKGAAVHLSKTRLLVATKGSLANNDCLTKGSGSPATF